MHIISGKVRKAPYTKPLQDGTMLFIVELSEMVKDRQTGENCYTNYSVSLFAKTPAAIDFHTKATSEGSFIVVSGDKLKINKQQGSNGQEYIKLELQNCRLDDCSFDSNAQPQQQQAPQMQQQAPQQQWGQQASQQPINPNGGQGGQGYTPPPAQQQQQWQQPQAPQANNTNDLNSDSIPF